MSSTVEKYPNEPIIQFTALDDYDVIAELGSDDQKVIDILNQSKEWMYLINVFNAPLSVEALMEGAKQYAGDVNSLWRHPKLKKVVFVSSDAMLRMSMAGFRTEVFGNIDIQAVDTLEEARALIRADYSK